MVKLVQNPDSETQHIPRALTLSSHIPLLLLNQLNNIIIITDGHTLCQLLQA